MIEYDGALFHLTPAEWAGTFQSADVDRLDGLDWWQDVADTLPVDVLAAIVEGLTPRLRPAQRWLRPITHAGEFWQVPLTRTRDVLATIAEAARPMTTADVIRAVGYSNAGLIADLQGRPRG